MKNLIQNQVGCDLMVWETQPQKRNTNNQVKFVTPTNQNINIGDVIVGGTHPKPLAVTKLPK